MESPTIPGSRVQALGVLLRRAARQVRGACPVMDEVHDALRSNAGLRLSYVQRARAVLGKPMPEALAPSPPLEADGDAPLPELYVAPSEELRVRIATISVCLGKAAAPARPGSRCSARAPLLPPPLAPGTSLSPLSRSQRTWPRRPRVLKPRSA